LTTGFEVLGVAEAELLVEPAAALDCADELVAEDGAAELAATALAGAAAFP
jgi:hypothetical protein